MIFSIVEYLSKIIFTKVEVSYTYTSSSLVIKMFYLSRKSATIGNYDSKDVF